MRYYQNANISICISKLEDSIAWTANLGYSNTRRDLSAKCEC